MTTHNAPLLVALVSILATGLGPGGLGAESGSKSVEVNCARGETIRGALENHQKDPLVIVVLGTCHENVVIARGNVTVRAHPTGGAVDGPDAAQDTLAITGSRVAVDGLTVTGGRNGISATGARGLTIRNCSVGATGRMGVVFFQGATGLVDACAVTGNPVDGILVEAAVATVINSNVSQNGRAGIRVANNGSARIGIRNDDTAYAGNSIGTNGANGIAVSDGSAAVIGGNIITGNGTNASDRNRAGVQVNRAAASLVGGNRITNNAASGVFAVAGQVLVGDAVYGLPIGNTITGNGFLDNVVNARGGLLAVQTGTIVIRQATISGNAGNGVTAFANSLVDIGDGSTSSANVFLSPGLFGGHGVVAALRSVARVRETGVSIFGNPGAGVYLESGGALDFRLGSTATGNSGYGLNCVGQEASVSGNLSGITGNAPADIAPTCTGF